MRRIKEADAEIAAGLDEALTKEQLLDASADDDQPPFEVTWSPTA